MRPCFFSLIRVYLRSSAAENPRTIAFTILPQSHKARPDSIMDREIGNDHLVLYDVASRTMKDVYDPKVDVSAGNSRIPFHRSS